MSLTLRPLDKVGRKRASNKIKPSKDKLPSGKEKAGIRTLPFRWTTRDCDYDGPFGWCKASHQDIFLKVIPKLQNFESQSWGEIETESNNNHHSIEIDQLCPEARQRLPDTKCKDMEELFSLRLEGAFRVWGARREGVFEVLWYDPQHQVYPVVKSSDKRREADKKRRNQQSTSK